ncbi:hypothetical protein lerEdw1_003467 [Lerista edwardsae]|nr:hypothetical protein lerEdw1_003467 [Lerista edwardsae]
MLLRCAGWRSARTGMLPLLLMLLATLAEAGEAPGEASPRRGSRPYAVLKSQNLVLLGSVFSLLLIAAVLMAVCVYKPVRR